MQLTLDISDDLAIRINARSNALPRVLRLGLRELLAEDLGGFKGFSDVLEFLACLPTPQEILALRPSPALQEEMEQLLKKSRDTDLNAEEEEQWRRLEYLEHLVRKAKIHAAQRLRQS